jgi:hypothetical protein
MIGSSPTTLAHRRQNQQKRPPPRPTATCRSALLFSFCSLLSPHSASQIFQVVFFAAHQVEHPVAVGAYRNEIFQTSFRIGRSFGARRAPLQKCFRIRGGVPRSARLRKAHLDTTTD